MPEEEKYISLYQLTKKIESALKDPDLSFKWVTFEIKSLNVNQSNGHCYLELIEKAPNGTTIASARGTIWSSIYFKIRNKFTKVTGMELQKGMKVLALVSVSFHSLYGISINISDIDPAFTLGESERIRRETIEKLHSDGVWDMNRLLQMPLVIQKIAVVSSPTAAGYGDFCRQIEESGLKMEITLFESLMQGNQAEDSIMNSLEEISNHADEFDAIVIIRGGGASGDLDCFDGYLVCSAIAQMPLPVITGIGHDRDVSIADMVAANALKTPTAVAAWIIGLSSEFLSRMERITSEIVNKVQNTLLELWNDYEMNCSLLRHRTEGILSSRNLQISEVRNMLSRITTSVSLKEQSRISREEEILRQGTIKLFSEKSSALDFAKQNLAIRWKMRSEKANNDIMSRMQLLQSVTSTRCEKFLSVTDRLLAELKSIIKLKTDREEMKISSLKDKIAVRTLTVLKNRSERNSALLQLVESHDPRNVLQRGYAMVRLNGTVIADTTHLSVGDRLDIILRDGEINTEIKNINK